MTQRKVPSFARMHRFAREVAVSLQGLCERDGVNFASQMEIVTLFVDTDYAIEEVGMALAYLAHLRVIKQHPNRIFEIQRGVYEWVESFPDVASVERLYPTIRNEWAVVVTQNRLTQGDQRISEFATMAIGKKIELDAPSGFGFYWQWHLSIDAPLAILYLEKPTAEFISAFRIGVPEFRFIGHELVAAVLLRFDKLPWLLDTFAAEGDVTKGVAYRFEHRPVNVQALLVDETGVLRAFRRIALNDNEARIHRNTVRRLLEWSNKPTAEQIAKWGAWYRDVPINELAQMAIVSEFHHVDQVYGSMTFLKHIADVEEVTG